MGRGGGVVRAPELHPGVSALKVTKWIKRWQKKKKKG